MTTSLFGHVKNIFYLCSGGESTALTAGVQLSEAWSIPYGRRVFLIIYNNVLWLNLILSSDFEAAARSL